MGTGFRRQAGRLGVTGVAGAVLAASAALIMPGSANAAEVIEGKCESTLKGEDGQPLKVDLTALLNETGLSVGTASDSDSLLSLPLKETLKGLGVNESGAVVDSLGNVCDTAKNTVNALAAPVKATLPEEGALPGDPVPPPSEDEPEPTPPPEEPGGDPENPENPEAPGGEPGGGDGTAPGEGTTPGSGPGVANPDSGIGSSSGDPNFVPSQGGTVSVNGFAGLPPINIPPAASIPPVAPPVAPDLNQPKAGDKQDKRPEVTAKNSGTAEALPAENAPDRLPLLLAVIALVLVIAGLARTWLRRKAV